MCQMQAIVELTGMSTETQQGRTDPQKEGFARSKNPLLRIVNYFTGHYKKMVGLLLIPFHCAVCNIKTHIQ